MQALRPLIIVLLITALGGQAAAKRPRRMPPSPAGTWLRTEGKPKAVALVLHGMNIKPQRMDTIARILTSSRVDCYRGTLTGHDGDMQALKRVTRRTLLRDTAKAYRKAAARAKKLGVPLYLVGFSLGALLPNDLAARNKRVRFDKMILFAPELTPHAVANLVRPLRPFSRLVLPSSFPRQYSVHKGTPIAVYASMLDSVSALRKAGYEHARKTPTIIFADAGDKLANTAKLARTIRKNKLDAWKLFHIHGEGKTYAKGMGHLVIDGEAVGAKQWQKIEATIRDFVR
jgi:dienelactone hydrolase